MSEIRTSRFGSFCNSASTSMPRRPRWRRMPSGESAIYCNSFSTKRGMRSVPGKKPVLAISATRPSMITLVSSRMVRLRFVHEEEPPPSLRPLNAPSNPMMSPWRMTKSETPKYEKTKTPMKGRIWLKGCGRSESGNASRAAISKPTTNPVIPAKRLSAASRPSIDRRNLAGRVVKYGVRIKPANAPINEKVSVVRTASVGLSLARSNPQYPPAIASTIIPIMRRINSKLINASL